MCSVCDSASTETHHSGRHEDGGQWLRLRPTLGVCHVSVLKHPCCYLSALKHPMMEVCTINMFVSCKCVETLVFCK